MKYLVDAHLPRRLAQYLRDLGHDVLHTRDLPYGNRTGDTEINALSIQEQRIVVTKDADFVNSFALHGKPYKLLLVSTGNIGNEILLELFRKHIMLIETALTNYSSVEINRTGLIIHA
jgi:predicted nuclease of predicted toxin-antitoxin system